MSRATCILLVLSCWSVAAVSVQAAEVNIVQEDGKLLVSVGDAEFATYIYSDEFRKPFFLPVKVADGTVLTRKLNDPDDDDHPHHKGVWVAVDEIEGIKYWVERGRIANRAVTVVNATGNPAIIEVTNDWKNVADDASVITEQTRISIFANRLMAYDIRFIAEHGPVEFGDTKEGLLGYRMTPSMKERNTGKVVSSDGTEGTGACWGQPFPWVDYSGTVGEKTYGVTLMDHPDNFRPSRYHVRNYGLFSISPFGERAYTNGKEDAKHVHLKQGEELRLQYGIYFHDGDVKSGDVAGAYVGFLKATRQLAPQQ
jgi:hypothetical protein